MAVLALKSSEKSRQKPKAVGFTVSVSSTCFFKKLLCGRRGEWTRHVLLTTVQLGLGGRKEGRRRGWGEGN